MRADLCFLSFRFPSGCGRVRRAARTTTGTRTRRRIFSSSPWPWRKTVLPWVPREVTSGGHRRWQAERPVPVDEAGSNQAGVVRHLSMSCRTVVHLAWRAAGWRHSRRSPSDGGVEYSRHQWPPDDGREASRVGKARVGARSLPSGFKAMLWERESARWGRATSRLQHLLLCLRARLEGERRIVWGAGWVGMKQSCPSFGRRARSSLAHPTRCPPFNCVSPNLYSTVPVARPLLPAKVCLSALETWNTRRPTIMPQNA